MKAPSAKNESINLAQTGSSSDSKVEQQKHHKNKAHKKSVKKQHPKSKENV